MPKGQPKAVLVLSEDERSQLTSIARSRSISAALVTRARIVLAAAGHTSVATTGRYITINLQMKRDAMQAFWKNAGIEPATKKPWKPKADLLAFLQSL